MKWVDGLACSADPTEPLLAMLALDPDETTRINGAYVCPKCELVWPVLEDLEDGEWGLGYGVCLECSLAFFEGIDQDLFLYV